MLARTIWAHERLREQDVHIRLLDGTEAGHGTLERAASVPGIADSKTETSVGTDWMSRLDDNTLVSALTIPGTHDSAAYTVSWPFVQTQVMDISAQLDAGIRYFDLRCGIRDNVAEMVHGPKYLGLTLNEVLGTMYSWLKYHESEAVIVQIKQDRESERSTVHFAQAIWKCLAPTPERWRTANTTPTLGELRGKIQLLRRFNGPTLQAYGIDVSEWQDNPRKPFTIYGKNQLHITIQDHYSFSDPESLPSVIIKKGGDVSELLRRAAADPCAAHWYVNFTSAYEFNIWYQLPPREVAIGGWWAFQWEEGMNPRLRNYLREHEGKRRYGIVAMDFPEHGSDDLIEALIASNYEHRGLVARFWWPLLLDMLGLLLSAGVITTGIIKLACHERF